MNFEGIILSKIPYKEKDLICKVLLRSGKTLSFYFYGGRGSSKSKSSFLELGHMIQILQASNPKESGIQIAKEYSLLWEGKKIRLNYRAFYLACFVLEVVQRISVEDHVDSYEQSEFEGIFKICSNLLFHVDKSLEEEKFNLKAAAFVFLAKLLQELGALPDLNRCGTCEADLTFGHVAQFIPLEGHFICQDCGERNEFDAQGLLSSLKQALNRPIRDYWLVGDIENPLYIQLFNYLCYQFELKKENIKTWSTIRSF